MRKRIVLLNNQKSTSNKIFQSVKSYENKMKLSVTKIQLKDNNNLNKDFQIESKI